mgnify:CR=1 FL=1
MKLSIETTLTLEHHAKGVKVQTTVVNTAKDHRLRVLFPAGLDSDMQFCRFYIRGCETTKPPWKGMDQSERM